MQSKNHLLQTLIQGGKRLKAFIIKHLHLKKKEKRLLVVYRQMPTITVSTPVTLLLPPQFYTMTREALSLNYAYQARKIAPAIFEGLLEERETYRYFVYKEGSEWIFIAYDPEELREFFLSKGITLQMISGIYFAQQCVDSLDAPIQLGEKEVLTTVEGTAVVVPKIAIETDQFIAPSACQLPKQAIHFDAGYKSIFSLKESLILASLLIAFGLMWFVEGRRYIQSNAPLTQELEQLLEENPAMQNAYTRDNISQKYRDIDRKERHKRHVMKTISLMLHNGVTLTALQVEPQHFKAVLNITDKGAIKRVETLIKNAGYKAQHHGNQMIIEGQL